jgi:hypothetical protein
VAAGRVSPTAGDPLERDLEGRVLERLDLAAVVAHEVVVMLAAGARGLEPRDPVAQVDALDETEVVESFEGAIDACDPDARASSAQTVVNLLGGHAAGLSTDELDDGAACAATPSTHRMKTSERSSDPGLGH